MIELDGRFWLTKDNRPFLGEGRVELLKKIDEIGSIHSASKAMKMSYKAAWDMLKQMNELADRPLLEKQIGGRGGGGTKLTPYAYELIETFEKFSKLHRRFMDRFKEAGDSPEKLQSILNRTFLTTSARNQFLCKVADIKKDGAVSTLTLSFNNNFIKSKITTKSLMNMGFGLNDNIYAIIKSSDIKTLPDKPQDISENDNLFKCKIVFLEKGENNTEIHLKSDNDLFLVCVAKTKDSIKYKIDDHVYAIIKSDNVLIGM